MQNHQNQLVKEIVEYFRKHIFDIHIESIEKKHSKLKSYKINPIIVKYLSKLLVNDFTPNGVAKALLYPRILGTSINTSFGTAFQKMFVDLNLAEGSMIPGMDIEFVDKTDNRKKWCQLKSGPNTINSEDVAPLVSKFNKTINLARTNNISKGINNTDFIVGVLYGEPNELSMHYKNIDKVFPVYIGKEFWYRITGYEEIYSKIEKELHTEILTLKTDGIIENGLVLLEKDIVKSNLFNFNTAN